MDPAKDKHQHARIHGFLPGGSSSDCQITALITGFFVCFFIIFFLVLNLFYSLTEGAQWLFQRKLFFPKFQRGSNIFQGGPTFSRGGGGEVQMLISIETHITCDFPGGSPNPLFPRLDPCMIRHHYQPMKALHQGRQ